MTSEMKQQIGVGNKLIDAGGLVSLIIIDAIITFNFPSHFLQLTPFYLAIILYSYMINRKWYVYFEHNTFIIENLFRKEKFDAAQYEGLSTMGLETFFANNITIAFKNGRTFKFMSGSRDIEALEKKISSLIQNANKEY
jgi:hypothetical protein